MSKINLLLIIFLTFTLKISAQNDISKAKWQSKKIVIDGNNNEWDKPFSFYDSKSGLTFALANDSTNMYLCFTDDDEWKIRKMMRAGWSIELVCKEKNNKFNASIAFPGLQTMNVENNRTRSSLSLKADLNNLINTYILHVSRIKTKGFKTKNGELPIIENNGIMISIGAVSGQYIVYEIAIPFKELFTGKILRYDELLTLIVTVNTLQSPSYNSKIPNRGSDVTREDSRNRDQGGRYGNRAEDNTSVNNDEVNKGMGELLGESARVSFKQKFRLTEK
jgi:hypothetical protein